MVFHHLSRQCLSITFPLCTCVLIDVEDPRSYNQSINIYLHLQKNKHTQYFTERKKVQSSEITFNVKIAC
jgi:hypothetical protein